MLRAGCLESDYNEKALAFVNQIMPNLAQKYEPADAGEYLIDLMPLRLAPDKRRLKAELNRNGLITDLREVQRQCSAIVFEDQDYEPGNDQLTRRPLPPWATDRDDEPLPKPMRR